MCELVQSTTTSTCIFVLSMNTVTKCSSQWSANFCSFVHGIQLKYFKKIFFFEYFQYIYNLIEVFIVVTYSSRFWIWANFIFLTLHIHHSSPAFPVCSSTLTHTVHSRPCLPQPNTQTCWLWMLLQFNAIITTIRENKFDIYF